MAAVAVVHGDGLAATSYVCGLVVMALATFATLAFVRLLSATTSPTKEVPR
jgi:hypothetical protein